MADRVFHCKECGEGISGPGPGVIMKHKKEVHGSAAPTGPRKSKTGRTKIAAPVADPEAVLLAQAVNLFAGAETDRDADFRILAYLNSRFGPEAYKDEAEE